MTDHRTVQDSYLDDSWPLSGFRVKACGQDPWDEFYVNESSDESQPTQPTESSSKDAPTKTDPVNHPAHYTQHPSGVECIQVTEHMNFNRGNAIKYIWRAGDKGDVVQDLQKARWYIDREIQRLTN